MKLKTIAMTVMLIFTSGVALANTGIPANPYKQPDKAFNYIYSRVVTQNTPDEWAEYLLGSYYQRGYGTKSDVTKAYVWYRMSTVRNYKPAISALANLKKSMTTSQVKKAEKQYILTRNESINRELRDLKKEVGY